MSVRIQKFTDQLYQDMATHDIPNIPNHMRAGVENYVVYGIEPGGFLTSLLCNDFMGVVSRADGANAAALKNWVFFIYNCLPSSCWKNQSNLISWCESGGLAGQWERDGVS